MSSVDSTVVTRQLREHLRPRLREAGFSKFTGRTSWRDLGEIVWVVNAQSFSSHIAHGVGCTTYSFGVNLGIYYRGNITSVSPNTWPRVELCTFRFVALKSIAQPMFHPYGQRRRTDRRDVWYVTPDGSNIMQAVQDATAVILGPGLSQLTAYSDPEYAYCALFDYARTLPPRAVSTSIEPVAFGRFQSPAWQDRVNVIAPMIGRSAHNDIANGLPTSVMESVLDRFPPLVEPHNEPPSGAWGRLRSTVSRRSGPRR